MAEDDTRLRTVSHVSWTMIIFATIGIALCWTCVTTTGGTVAGCVYVFFGVPNITHRPLEISLARVHPSKLERDATIRDTHRDTEDERDNIQYGFLTSVLYVRMGIAASNVS